ncbi:unnamed protein product [Cladocopium goreaui]|uniref:ATPase AAA-type core domain-containing protein n=1 Tax=Cladocopium goreaui TaxID=2562237 RepID=A0A9P1D9N1_9DINO|nr:unnamed protein product [Cladocopium goreaui]
MLDTNPWVKSRFSHFIEFGDCGLEDCLHLFHKRAATGNFTLQEAAELELKDGFSTLLPLDGCGSRCGQSLESFPPRLGPCFTGFQDGSHFCSVDSGAGSCSCGTGRTRAWLKDAQKASDFVHSRSSE